MHEMRTSAEMSLMKKRDIDLTIKGTKANLIYSEPLVNNSALLDSPISSV